MSRTKRSKPINERRFYCGRARGISKAKTKLTRKVRCIQNRILYSSEDPIIEQPKKYHNFWWEWL